jgi:hypothetical protein
MEYFLDTASEILRRKLFLILLKWNELMNVS